MADASKISPFPVILVQDIINNGYLNTWKGNVVYGNKYFSTLSRIIRIQSDATVDCFDKIFKVPEEQMVDLPDDYFDVLNTL